MPKYTDDDVQKALEDIKNGAKIQSTAKKHGIPRSTLSDKVSGKSPRVRKMGPETILSIEEENVLERWVLHLAAAGFPVSKDQLLDRVQELFKKTGKVTPFIDGRPGRHWYLSFLKRHPIISKRITQNLTNARANVTEQNIRKWFAEVHQFLLDNHCLDILDDPDRIFNTDETAFFFSPKGGTVLAKKGQKAVYSHINNDEKECLTVLFTGNAAGVLAPPMVVYPYVQLPQSIVYSMPVNWAIGRSDSGWQTGQTFYEFMANVFKVK